MSILKTFIEWITPPEVSTIASQLLSAADQAHRVRKQLIIARDELDGTWTGGAAKDFFNQLNGLINAYNGYVLSLHARAAQILAITVWVEVQKWVEDQFGGNP